jgi:hypothetical protein
VPSQPTVVILSKSIVIWKTTLVKSLVVLRVCNGKRFSWVPEEESVRFWFTILPVMTTPYMLRPITPHPDRHRLVFLEFRGWPPSRGRNPTPLTCLVSIQRWILTSNIYAMLLNSTWSPILKSEVGRKGKNNEAKYSVISIQISWQCSKLPYMHYDENSFRSFAFFCSCCPPWLLLLRMSHSIVFWQNQINVEYLVIFPWIRLYCLHLLSLTRSIFWPKLNQIKSYVTLEKCHSPFSYCFLE